VLEAQLKVILTFTISKTPKKEVPSFSKLGDFNLFFPLKFYAS
jgi:hypothetical protein